MFSDLAVTGGPLKITVEERLVRRFGGLSLDDDPVTDISGIKQREPDTFPAIDPPSTPAEHETEQEQAGENGHADIEVTLDASKGNGLMEAVTPRTKKMLKMFEPTMLPTAMSARPL